MVVVFYPVPGPLCYFSLCFKTLPPDDKGLPHCLVGPAPLLFCLCHAQLPEAEAKG